MVPGPCLTLPRVGTDLSSHLLPAYAAALTWKLHLLEGVDTGQVYKQVPEISNVASHLLGTLVSAPYPKHVFHDPVTEQI